MVLDDLGSSLRGSLDKLRGKSRLDEEDVEEGLDVPVVVTGGTSMPEGFEKLFERHLEDADIPFSISGVRHADEPMYSVARGGLVAARSDEDQAGGANAGTSGAEEEPVEPQTDDDD